MGHVLPENKSIWVGLTSVYGIGLQKSKKILDNVKIDHLKKIKDISEEEQKKIVDEIKHMILENDLKREI
jgi:small subunit ribosomal protein S13